MFKDKNGTVIPCILMSDETPLSLFSSEKKCHPVYLSIGNVPKEIRRKPSSGAIMLAGYLPADVIICETNPEKCRCMRWKMFHECLQELLEPLSTALETGLEAICGDGNVRRIYPFIASHIADFPEQCKVANIKNTYCPICTVNWRKKGDLDFEIPLRRHRKTMAAIDEHNRVGSAKFEMLGLQSGEPFWAKLPYIDIATLHTPDLLHQLHRGVFKDHLAKWVNHMKTEEVVDGRYRAMTRHAGLRHFKGGINVVSRWTGREMKEMAKVMLPVMADCPPQAVEAARALFDFIYIAHASSLTDDDLDVMDAALARFHELKEVFSGALGSELGFHNIPKIHMMQHYTHNVRMLGTPDGFNSEMSERLHIDFVKAGFRASNKVTDTLKKQMTVFIQRMESLALYRTYLEEQSALLDEEDELDDQENGWELDSDDGNGEEEGTASQNTWERESMTKEGYACTAGNVGGDQPDHSTSERFPIFYPQPMSQTAQTPTFRLTGNDLVNKYGATNFLNELSKFLSTPGERITIVGTHQFNIWSRVRLFHSPPPFRPSEPATVEVIRVIPTKLDEHGAVRRPEMFDTVLVGMYPERQGIHRRFMLLAFPGICLPL
jgi:hypothetical protein